MFLPAEQGEYGERRVYKLDIVERDVEEAVARLERDLKYPGICSGAAIDAARADYRNVARERQMRATLPDAWRKLVEEEDELLLELLADRVEALCGYKPDPDTVAAFLRESVQLKSAPTIPLPARLTPAAPPSEKRETRIAVEAAQPFGVGFVLNGRFHSSRNARDVRNAIERIVRMAAEVAGLRWGTDVNVNLGA